MVNYEDTLGYIDWQRLHAMTIAVTISSYDKCLMGLSALDPRWQMSSLHFITSHSHLSIARCLDFRPLLHL